MKNCLYRNLMLIGCGAIFAVSGFSQKKDPPDKKTAPTAPAARKFQLSKMENAVFDELNQARKQPKIYVGYLEEQRAAMRGMIVRTPNKVDVRTIEGAAAIDEAVGDLNRVADLKDFTISEGLTGVARAQLTDLQGNSKLGHFGKDGSDLKTRLARFGSSKGKCGENICHRGLTAREVVAIFLVDDGVAAHPHRKAVLSRNFKQIGVACGAGKNAESLCVVVFADDFKEKSLVSGTVEF